MCCARAGGWLEASAYESLTSTAGCCRSNLKHLVAVLLVLCSCVGGTPHTQLPLWRPCSLILRGSQVGGARPSGCKVCFSLVLVLHAFGIVEVPPKVAEVVSRSADTDSALPSTVFCTCVTL